VTEIDVLIAGGGPVGLMLACELQRRGVSYRIVTQLMAIDPHSRAIGMQPRTLEILAPLGVTDRLAAAGNWVDGITVSSEGRERADIDLQGLAGETPYPRILIVPEAETEAALEAALVRLGGRVERGRALTGFDHAADGVTATVNGDSGEETIRARWLVGCDGAHSVVRHTLGLGFEGAQFPERFWLADVQMNWSRTLDRAHAFFHPDGIAVAFPFGNDRWRVMMDVPDQRDAADPTLERLRAAFSERAGQAVAMADPRWIGAFAVHHRMVETFRRGRVFLAGDAAHIHSPVGGQGMNTGIQDAHNLAWKLAIVIHGRATEALLDTYDAERRPVARRLLRDVGRATHVVTGLHPALRLFRDQVLLRLVQLGPIRALISQRVAEFDVSYEESLLSSGRGHPAPGRRAPFVFLTRPDGRSATIFDVFDTVGFTALVFAGLSAGDAATAAATVARGALGDLGSVVVVAPSVSADWDGPLLLDRSGAAHQRYGASNGALVLVRPDGYLGFRGRLDDGPSLMRYLQRAHVAA
jgi:2-polyprenyl-6-methoxyphenol hydroxylase-like FAD-dependent oxidoreductase